MKNVWIRSIVYSGIATVIFFLTLLVVSKNFSVLQLIGIFSGVLFIAGILIAHNNITKADAIKDGIAKAISVAKKSVPIILLCLIGMAAKSQNLTTTLYSVDGSQLVHYSSNEKNVKGDTLVISDWQQYKFIKIGDNVYKISSPKIDLVYPGFYFKLRSIDDSIFTWGLTPLLGGLHYLKGY